ncbi:MAG: hypothetical protein LBU18_06100 [Treponema sp.]|jgi:hypothetical protein|nr:hypothetical protein [Treponema sp.]
MATIDCPVLGTWTNGGTSIQLGKDGNILVNAADTYSFLVWESGSTHQLITVNNSGVVDIYSFVVTSTALILTGSGSLAGSYMGTISPGPLSLSNDFLNAWNAIDPASAASWRWLFQFGGDGIVTTTHLAMQHTFANAYAVRMTGASPDSGYLVIRGQMRYNPDPILSKWEVSAANEIKASEAVAGGHALTFTKIT